MSERTFRFIQGLYILASLYLENAMMMYVYMAVIAFEGVTNLRVPLLISRLRYGRGMVENSSTPMQCRFKFESERMLRVVVFVLMVLTYIVFPVAWFFPWFIGVMLLLAGITNICPMVMFMRYLGFR